MDKFFIAIVTAALAVALLILTLFKPEIPTDKPLLMIMLPAAVLGIGAIGFFMSSLQHFKPALKRPYLYLSLGIMLMPMPHIITSLVILANKPDLLTYTFYIAGAVYVLATPLLFAGMRRFAQLLSVRFIWSSVRFVVPVAVAMAIVVTILVHLKAPPEVTLMAKVIIGLTGLSIVFGLAATIVAIRIRGIIGGSYVPAMRWLVVALAITTFTYVHELLVTLLLPVSLLTYAVYATWPYLVAALIFAWSGRLFWVTSRLAQTENANLTYLDAVLYASRLVSNPAAIDPTLDRMRVITSRLAPGEELSAKDKTDLTAVYQEIEAYLTTKDPIRRLTREDLRSHLTYDFQQVLKQQTA